MTADDVLAALGTVYDPELDEPITALQFVASCEVADDGAVSVRLRLPTPQCAPNFAFLMAADARDAVRTVPGVRRGLGRARGPLHGHGDQRGGRAATAASATPSRARPRASSTRCASCSAARRWWRARARLLETVADPVSARLGDLAGPDAGALPRAAQRARASTRPTTRRRSCAATARPSPRAELAAVRAHGLADRDLARGQRGRVPVPAVKSATASRRWPHEGGEAARVPPGAQARLGRGAEGDRPVRRGREDRGGGAVPHRPAHPGGPVGGEVRGRRCPTRPGTRTRAGSTRSAPA